MTDGIPERNSRRIAFFAHERGDARVAKRIAALGVHGWAVTGFMFHRDRGKPDVSPPWENVDLGTTYNRRYFHRLWTLAKSVVSLVRERQRFRSCSLIYAVNTDNAALALLGRALVGGKMPLVLELADVQPVMTGDGWISCCVRWIERRVLARSEMLVTTSPGFVEHYFLPVQRFGGRVFLLENKVFPSGGLPETAVKTQPVEGGKPWVVGYFGAFRCRRSMELIHALSKRLPGRIRFVLRGYASGTITEDFSGLLGDLPNLEFGGPYHYPEDLAGMYGGVDFNWCFDEADPSGNSEWLLPNRIYEGGLFKVPALAAARTETGRWVTGNGCGREFREPLLETLTEFFLTLEEDRWRQLAVACGRVEEEKLRGEGDYERLALALEECLGSF